MVKKGEERKNFTLRWFVVLIILALAVYLVWFLFFSYKECDNWDCFNSRLGDCKRTTFIGGANMVFDYTIFGKEGGSCIVGVQLLQGGVSDKESKNLEGQKMKCALPLEVIMIPESDILNCHGVLKEGLQDLIIKKLHTYIVQNIGKINLEVLDAPTGK